MYQSNRGYGQNRRNNYGGGRQHNGGGQKSYTPNTGMLRPNREKQTPQQPDFKGVCNVEVNGQLHTLFMSLWVNRDQQTGETKFRVTFTPPNQPQQNGHRQQSQFDNGQYQGGYQQPPRQDQNGAYGQGGAMQRARPIQPHNGYQEQPHNGYQSAPPPAEYPEGPDYDEGVTYPDDPMPF